MNINKTADECIIETSSILLKTLVDPKLSLAQKQIFTQWLTYFFDYQDAINTAQYQEIDFLNEKLKLMPTSNYYKKALQEFQTANILYKTNFSLNQLETFFSNHAIKATTKAVTTLVQKIIKTIKSFNIKLETNFLKDFQILIYTIHYHLTYLFEDKLKNTVKTFTNIITQKIWSKKLQKETLLINIILKENENFFNQIQQVQLLNFIYKIDDIFQETSNIEETNKKINDLIFNNPKKLNVTMHKLLTENNIDIYQEIWKNNTINEKNSKLIMHLLAYETYFVQGYNNQTIYEDLVLKNVIKKEKYWIILHKYKLLNRIIKK